MSRLSTRSNSRTGSPVTSSTTWPRMEAVGRDSARREAGAEWTVAGLLVVREIRRNPQLGMDTVALLDDDSTKIGKHVHGVPVVGGLSSLAESIERFQIAEVIIAMPKATGSTVRSAWAHVWTVQAGKIIQFYEYVDTAAVSSAYTAAQRACSSAGS